jgi:hypothetical protein
MNARASRTEDAGSTPAPATDAPMPRVWFGCVSVTLGGWIMKVIVETVTPEKAAKYLEGNYASNRNIRPKAVSVYADAMRRGEWRLTGDSIKFSEDGTLIDGQHRLAAIIEAGVSVEMVVVFGLSFDVFPMLDQGVKRTNGDIFHIKNIPNACLVSAAMVWLRNYTSGTWYNFDRLSASDALALYKANASIQDSVRFKKVPGVQPSLCVALHYLMWHKDSELADAYFTSLTTGIGLDEFDPAYVVLRRLMRGLTTSERLLYTSKVELLIKGWNALRRGRHIAHIALTGDIPDII